jgi:hypothetical protein
MTKEKIEHRHKDETIELTLDTDSDEINTPVDLFDALPHHVQKNHKLLTAFCQWYLYSKHDKLISRSVSYYFRDQIQAMALKLHKENPNLKAPAILSHSDMRAFIKRARANNEAVASDDRWIRWIQDIIRIKKERGWDKSP